MILTQIKTVDVDPEIIAALRRAGLTIKASMVPGLFELYGTDGRIAAAGVSLENLKISAATW